MKQFLAALAIGLLLTGQALAQSDVDPNRYGSIVVDANSGKILVADHADRILHPASLTKLMTLYLTFAAMRAGKIDDQTQLTVSRYATQAAPTKLNLHAGEHIRVHDAVLGLITRSANDAARVLAEGIGGSESHFADMMTEQAQRLGMTHTVFRNASGLPNPGQVTTPKDMAMLARAIITQFPEYYELFSTRSFNYRGVAFTNHNHLMEWYPGMDGMKTGYVAASGFNLVSSAVQGNTRLIGVVFGGRSAARRDRYMAGLLDRSFMEAGGASRPGAVAARYADNHATLPDLSDEPDLASGGQDIAGNAQEDYPDNSPHDSERAKLQHVLASAVVTNDVTPDETADATPAANNAAVNQQPHASTKLAKGDWGVLLGSFRSRHDAKITLSRAQRHYRNLHDAHGVITVARTKGGVPIYHVRMIGLTQSAASQACSAMQSHGKDCTPVKPTG